MQNIIGDFFNISSVCPWYVPESQCSFTWHRDETGLAIVEGYDPEQDIAAHWLCECGHFETGGGRCLECGSEPPWGGDYSDDYDEDLDFSFEVDPFGYVD